MAAQKEITLNDIKINSLYLEDSLSAILHTILFVRAPSVVKAKDHACQNLSPLIYATCGPKEVDKIIDCMKGEVVLSFFDKREVKEYLGLVTRIENVCFESWRISIVLLDASVGDGIAALPSATSQQEKAAAYRSAYDQITNTMMSILEAVNTATDHIPATMYDYEIFVTQPTPCPCGDKPSNNSQKTHQHRVGGAGSGGSATGGAHRRGSSDGTGAQYR